MTTKGWMCANCGRLNHQTLKVCPCGSSEEVDRNDAITVGDDLLLQKLRLEALRDKFSKSSK